MKIRALINTKGAEEIPAWFQWRITNPFEHMNKYGIDIDARHEWAPIGWQFDPDLDILILPRIDVKDYEKQEVQKWFKAIQANGTKLIYECDDDVFSEDYVSQLAKLYWTPDKPIEMLSPLIDELERRRRDALWTLLQCDAVTVSSKALGAYVKTLTTAPVHVVNNAIDVDKFERGLGPLIPRGEFVFIGWAGGMRTTNDLEIMLEAWVKLAEQRPQVRFIFGGWSPKGISALHPTLVDKAATTKWLPVSEYGKNYQVDIGCCAINDNGFGRKKSPIKSWEYALAGAAVVASNVVYEDEPIILIAETVDDWLIYLKHLVDDEQARQTNASLFKQHVLQYHSLEYEWYNWKSTYQDIIKQ